MCENNRPVFDESIELADNAMLKHRIELFDQWDFEKNDVLGLDVYKILRWSNRKVWWICPTCNSSYDTKPGNRTLERNCPYCGGSKANHTNSLASKNPLIAKEWHPTLNGQLTPHDVTIGSGKKVWWYCQNCESSYDMTPHNKIKGKGCVFCIGRRVNHTNCLSTLNPDLASQWHTELNGELTPYDVTINSGKNVWWICSECKSDYCSAAITRNKGIGCPYCANQRVNHTNSLASLRPDLAKEWHPVKNGDLTIHNISCGSNKKVWWLGSCGHEWDMIVYDRHRGKSGCPYCSNHRVLKGFNDMWTTNPELAKLLLNPEDGYDHTQFSNLEADWKCRGCGELLLNKRVSNINIKGVSCPSCSDGKSYPEKVMYHLLKELKISFEWEKEFAWSERKRYDFYLPECNMVIESHGRQHYEGRCFESLGGKTLEDEQKNDEIKKKLAIENGIATYIVINSSESTIDFLKKEIINSQISSYYNLSQIDWGSINRKSLKSLVFEVWDLWATNNNITEVAENLQLSKSTVYRYVAICEKLNLSEHLSNQGENKEVI